MKLAIVTTHPIQYNAPLFEALAKTATITVKVFYTWGIAGSQPNFDPGFGKVIGWDLPLLQGYEYEFLHNAAKNQGTHHFNGINNPGIISNINHYEPNAILVYGWSFRSHLKIIRYYSGKLPLYFRGDSTLLNEKKGFSFKKILRRIFLKMVYSHIDYALYVGQNNKEYFLKHGVRNNQLIYAPHAIDNCRFSDNEKDHSAKAMEFRNELGYNNGEFIFLYVGKFQDVKNLDFLITTFKANALEDIRLVLVGNGPMEDQLRKLAHDDPRVGFIGFRNQSEMPAIYRIGHVFIMPSKSETWGLAINEAMACGRPVLVSSLVGSAVDLVEDGVNGYIFNSGDANDLNRCITLLYERRNDQPVMGKSSLQKINDFSYEKTVKAIEDNITKPGE